VILRLEASPEAILAAEEEAEQLLSSDYNKFNEGFETSDLKTARALIHMLRRSLARS
jgi:hypothetical protein